MSTVAPLDIGIRLVECPRFRPIPQILAAGYFTALNFILAIPFTVLFTVLF